MIPYIAVTLISTKLSQFSLLEIQFAVIASH